MYSRTIHSAKAILPLFAALTLTISTNAASAQSYHHKITVDPNVKTMLDSTDVLHLQVSLHKMENENLKFRLTALNPVSKYMIITIEKGDDVLFSQSVRQDMFDYVFDLSSLDDGNYRLMVFNGKERISKNIQIETATHVDREISVD
ncbi:MAG TPA: hypothetical protein VGS79_25025 [Puia sp.]|nr:hypothetical protein [Puia sp.]